MKRITLSLLSVIGLGMASAGCAMEGALPGEEGLAAEDGTAFEDANEENLGSISQEAAVGWFTGPFSWTKNQGHTRFLESVDTHVCALTRVSGQFLSWQEDVRVLHDGDRWFIQTFSGGAWVGGEAHCYRKDAFTASTATRFVSSERIASASIGDCATESITGLSGSAFMFLAGIGGEWAGGGEWARIDQSPSDSVASQLVVNKCADDLTRAYARSFRVGPTYGRLATFYTAEDRWGDVNSPTALFTAKNNQRVVMAKTRFTMCAFTKIQGKFNGGGEAAQIRAEMVDGVERWVLTTTKGAGSDLVRAEARCFARDQTG